MANSSSSSAVKALAAAAAASASSAARRLSSSLTNNFDKMLKDLPTRSGDHRPSSLTLAVDSLQREKMKIQQSVGQDWGLQDN